MRPTRRAFWLATLWMLIGLLPALNNWLPKDLAKPELQEQLIQLWQIATAGLLFLLVLDALGVRKVSGLIEVSRQHNDNLALGVWSPVTVRIRHRFKRAVPLQMFDHFPPDGEADQPHQSARLQPGNGVEFQYKVKINKRGNHRFGPVDLLLDSPMGFWQRRLLAGAPTEARVFPNFAAVAQYAMLAMEQQSAQLGIRQQQRRGEGMEFQQLREFRQGDSLRQIDWNASARQRKLISKEYQDEKDQQILFLVDCGRRMRSQDDALSHLDHALNAMLLMSYAALKQGDAVGLMSFGGQERWLKPVKGVANISKILHAAYDLEATTRASDYTGAVRSLLTRHSKRSLIVLLSNIRDENTDDLVPALRLLQRKHLVLVANLEEQGIHALLNEKVDSFDQALRHAATRAYLERRNQITRQFNRSGLITVNTTPQHMPVKLVNQYFDIKREGLL
ncbi:MAG: DUF58 domain-containing protein [Pseudomonadota bacterium]